MKIKTQFIITMLLFGMILVTISVSAIIVDQLAQKTSEQERIASSMAQSANELSYLSGDYLIYRESQQLKRWQSRFALLSSQVTRLKVDMPGQQALVRNIKANGRRLKEVFDSVAFHVTHRSPNQSATLDPTFFQVSWSRMAVQNQALVSDASRLSHLLRQQMDRLREIRTLLMYIIVGLFGLFLSVSYMLTYRRILKSITILQAGTAMIGAGDLDFKIEEKKNDEIGDLCHAFNRMTANLKDVTASKEELEKEIAEREKAEEALREAHERAVWLARFPDENPNPVLRVATDGRVLYRNPATTKIPGWACEVGQPLSNAFLPLVEKALTERRQVEKELQLGGKSYLAWVAPFPEEDYVNVYGRDITERKRMEEQLRQSEEKARLLIQYAPSMFYEIDFHQPAFKSVNDLMCQTLGYSREELLAMSPFDLLDDEGKALFRERIRRKFAGEEVSDSVEYKSKTKDGRDLYGILNLSFTYKDGKPQGAVVVAHDITERKRAEEALKRAYEELEKRIQERTEDLARANKSLRQLSIRLLSAQEEERKRIAGEIHDTLGSYLSAVKFKVESLFHSIGGKAGVPTEAMKAIIALIQEGIDDCRRIQLDLRPSMLDDLGLLPTLSWFCKRFGTIYSGIGIEQDMLVEEGQIPDSLKIVIYRVTQEAMNNIAKHSHANRVRLSLREIEGRMELSVEDNGQGFSYQNSPSSPDDPRRGFGLTNMKERIELSGGSFAIESEEGKGTVIRASWQI